MENSRFKIQDPSLQKSLSEKQQITILSYSAAIAATKTIFPSSLCLQSLNTAATEGLSDLRV